MNFLVRWLLYGCFLMMAAVGGFFIAAYSYKTINITQLEQEESCKPSIVLDDQGNELFRFALDKRSRIAYEKIPDVVTKAFVAAEDHSFFSHMGVCLKGIIRSALVNLYHRRVVQGASTITQQVARLLFLHHERTFLRKANEIMLALQLERHLTKEQILELYLNNVYFGRGIYGVEAAAQRFWNKSITQVSLDEAAVLAAVAKSAKFYSPLNAPLTARLRRDTVLRCMQRVGFITQQEYDIAQQKPLIIQEVTAGSGIRLYIQEWIRCWAEQQWGKKDLYSKGLTIQSTINASMQQAAEESFCTVAKEMRKTQGDSLNGGMVVMQAATGRMKVVVGGLDFIESQFNRAFQAYRQVGSSFKPILYALALTNGYDMDSVLVDEPIEIQQPDGSVWRPRNWNRTFEGPMTLVRALTYSNNSIAIKLLLAIGVQRLNTLLMKFGITRDLTMYPTSALGTAHATVKENAAAFNIFTNNGEYVEPFLVEWVKDDWGKTIWRHKEVRRRVLDAFVNAKIIKALTYRMELAKPFWKKDGWVDCQAIGKTGSTNGAATVWFVGATPEYTSAVYLGRDDNRPLGRYVYANQTAFPIWLHFAKKVKSSVKHFYFDPALQEVAIDWRTGEKAQDGATSGVVTILK